MKLASRLVLSILVSLLLISCGSSADDPPDGPDGTQDTGIIDTDGGDDSADASAPDLDCVDGETGEILNGWCLIDGLCVEEGDANPDAPCQVCHPDGAADSWTGAADDTLCTVETDDGEADGTCQDGLCVPDEDTTVDCDCEDESDCCDGCDVINVGGDCGDDTLPCTANTCSEAGVCEQTVLDGWCLAGDGTTADPYRCADTATDLDNCGTCGNQCAEGAVCSSGECLIMVTQITMEPARLELDAGQFGSFNITIIPEDATDKTLDWHSDNPDVAIVDEKGVIEALSEGESTITVTAGGESATGLVVVTVRVEEVHLEPTALDLKVGDQTTLTAAITPANATNQRVTWESSHEEVATVSDTGMVTALVQGEATITVTTEDGDLTATCLVSVTNILVETIQVDSPASTVLVTEQVQLTAAITPANATDQRITWESSDQEVATVDPAGLVTGVLAGTAQITATTVDGGHTDTTTITVIQPVTGVELSPGYLPIPVDTTNQLELTVLPPNASDKGVTWESSNTDVATVDGAGLITGHQPGEATITVTTNDGAHTAVAAVQVYTPVTGVTIDQGSLLLEPDETGQLTATVEPATATFRSVTWESLDEGVATVDQNGVVTPVSVGTTTVQVCTEDGEFTDSVTIIVRVPLESVEILPDEITIKMGSTEQLTLNIHPNEATTESVNWESMDTDVATVNNHGEVTPTGDGTTVIQATVTTADETYTAQCMVTVDIYLWFNVIERGTNSNLEPTGITQDGDGNVYTIGTFRGVIILDDSTQLDSNDRNQSYIVKYDSQGDLLWGKAVDGKITGLDVDSQGRAVVVGETSSSPLIIDQVELPAFGSMDIFMVQLDPEGTLLWGDRYGTEGTEGASGVAIDHEDNIIVAGYYNNHLLDLGDGPMPFYNALHLFIAKYDSQGNHIWNTTVYNNTTMQEYHVKVDGAGNVFMGGWFVNELRLGMYTLGLPDLGYAFYFIKLDGDGDPVWLKAYPYSGSVLVDAFTVDEDGNAYIAGLIPGGRIEWGDGIYLDGPGPHYSYYVGKLDQQGDYAWSHSGITTSFARPFGIATDRLGNMYLSGFFADSLDMGGDLLYDEKQTNNASGFLGKFAGDGTHLWSTSYESNSLVQGQQVSVDGDGWIAFTAIFHNDVTLGNTTLEVPQSDNVLIVKMKP